MEAEGRVHGAQEPRTSPAEGGGEGARPRKTRKRRSWTAEEDAVLLAHVRAHGVGNWDQVPGITGLARSGQSLRFRWLNSLLPGLKNGVAFSRDEELHLCRLHAALGNKWSRIAAEMEGRSEYEVMTYWFAYVRRCQQAGLNVYPPEVQAAARQSVFHQPQRKRHKSQTSSSPQQPPPPPYNLPPVGYPHYPVVPTYLPQQLGVVYPVTPMAIAPPPTRPTPLPVMAEASSTSQFSAPLLPQSNQIVQQGMQPQPPALPMENATEFNENDQRLASLLGKKQTQPPELPLGEHEIQAQPPTLPMENATEFSEEGQPLTSSLLPSSNQNVEQGWQPQPPALPTEFNEGGQTLTPLPPLPNQMNVEQERRPQSPAALPLENETELNEGGQPLTSLLLQPLSDQTFEQALMQPQSPGSAVDFYYYDEFFGAYQVLKS